MERSVHYCMVVKEEPSWEGERGADRDQETHHDTAREHKVFPDHVKETFVEEENNSDTEDIKGELSAEQAALYAGHEVKGELLLGPEGPQLRDAAFALHDAVNMRVESMSEEREGGGCGGEQRALRDCEVRLERVPALEALLSGGTPARGEEEDIHTTRLTTQLQPHACAICHATFALKSQLREHVVVHIHTPSSPERGQTRRGADGDQVSTWTWDKFDKNEVSQEPVEQPSEDQVPFSRTAEELPGAATLSERGGVADADSAASPTHNTPQHNVTDISSAATGYQCDGCGRSFRKKTSLKKHIHIHMSSGRLCSASYGDIRSSTFANKLLVLEHKNNAHDVEKPFHCSQCNYKCRVKSNLKTHQRIHTGEKPFQCSQCNYKCSVTSSLLRHQRIHTDEKPFQCSQCNYKCKWISYLKMHQRIHTGEKPFQCSQCNYKCRVKSNLKTHQTIHTGEKPFQCSQCNYKCSRKSSLLKHQRIHTGKKPFQCSQCNYKCSQKSSLRQHQSIHTGEKPFQCGQCNYKCSRKSSLLMHQGIHTGEKPFQCNQCNHKFSRKSSLQKHQRIHTGEKPFQCGQCNYKCSRKSSLLMHQRIHTGEKPFQCSQCNHKCSQKSSLLKHQRIHTGKKPFQCNQCNYKSSEKTNIQKHQRKHTGEKLFQCSQCNYKCSQKSSLRKHQSIHTGEKPFHFTVGNVLTSIVRNHHY